VADHLEALEGDAACAMIFVLSGVNGSSLHIERAIASSDFIATTVGKA
jgi:hypothetical protein